MNTSTLCRFFFMFLLVHFSQHGLGSLGGFLVCFFFLTKNGLFLTSVKYEGKFWEKIVLDFYNFFNWNTKFFRHMINFLKHIKRYTVKILLSCLSNFNHLLSLSSERMYMLSDICNFKILFVCAHTYTYIFSFIRQMEVCFS